MKLLRTKDEVCLVKSWESEDCGTVTVKTCRGMETMKSLVKRHKEDIAELKELCPPTE